MKFLKRKIGLGRGERHTAHHLQWIAGLVFVLLSWFLFPQRTVSQTKQDIQWSDPILLSGGVPGKSLFPVIVSDESGGLHVFWLNVVDVSGVGQAVIYYSHWDGTTWSRPVDVVAVPGPYPLDGLPSAAVSPDNQIHIVWNSWGGIYHSRAYVARPATAKAWTTPRLIAEGRLQQPYLAILPDGSLHVAFLRSDGEAGIYYLRSDDGGASWTYPILVSNPFPDRRIPTVSETIHLVADRSETLHLVWTDMLSDPNNLYGAGVYYSHSTDRGDTWAEPLRIDDDWDQLGTPGTDDWLASLGIDGNNTVHVLWSATYQNGPSCARQHRWSPDGGASWMPRQRVLAPLFHCLGWMNMATDSAGTLHVVTIGGSIDGSGPLFHSRWTGNAWAPPTPVLSVVRPSGEWQAVGFDRPRMAISEGNILNVVWHSNNGDVWFVRGITDAPHQPPSPLPTPTAQPTDQVPSPTIPPIEPAATSTPEADTPQIAAQSSSKMATVSQQSGWWPILIGVIPALGLVAFALIIHIGRQR